MAKIVDIVEGSVIEVEYADGEIGIDLSPLHMKKFTPYSIGERVETRTTSAAGGEFFRCEIIDVFPDDKCEVRLLDNGRRLKVPQSWMRRSKSFAMGDIVTCPYKGTTQFFWGRIMKVNADGTYDVKFDDGDEEFNVILLYSAMFG